MDMQTQFPFRTMSIYHIPFEIIEERKIFKYVHFYKNFLNVSEPRYSYNFLGLSLDIFLEYSYILLYVSVLADVGNKDN